VGREILETFNLRRKVGTPMTKKVLKKGKALKSLKTTTVVRKSGGDPLD
jgi:hypothetical protein